MKFSISPNKKELIWGFAYLILQRTLLPFLLAQLLWRVFGISNNAIFNIVFFCVNFAALLWIFRRFLRDSLHDFLEHPWKQSAYVIGGIALYYGLNFFFSFWMAVLGLTTPNVNDNTVSQLLLEQRFWISLCVCVFAPFTEELLFRGLLFAPFQRRCAWLGYVLSIVAFSLVHVVDYIGMYPARTLVLCFLQYLPASLALALIYSRSKNIFVPMLVHAVNNSISLWLMR